MNIQLKNRTTEVKANSTSHQILHLHFSSTHQHPNPNGRRRRRLPPSTCGRRRLPPSPTASAAGPYVFCCVVSSRCGCVRRRLRAALLAGVCRRLAGRRSPVLSAGISALYPVFLYLIESKVHDVVIPSYVAFQFVLVVGNV